MKAALIPPIPMLPQYGRGDFHLLLSHLFINQDYVEHYRRERAHGAYLVLDNSAHEYQIGESAVLLRKQALDLKVQEVVIPDILEDAGGTLESAITAHEKWFEGQSQKMADLNPCLMYVPQATGPSEWGACLKELVSLHHFTSNKKGIRRDYAIGVSKDYEVWPGGLRYLIEAYLVPLRKKEKFQVHMLGWGRHLWELRTLAKLYPWIRSTDSAKPFVYALKDIALNPNSFPPMYPGRPNAYFSKRFQKKRQVLADHNCWIFRALARGEQ